MADRLLIVGRGRMGRLVETLAAEHGFEVEAALDSTSNAGGAGITAPRCGRVAVAIDFSTPAATLDSLPRLAGLGVPAVVGTTGWQEHEASLQRTILDARSAAVVAANFSLAANVMAAMAEHLGCAFATHAAYGAWVHEMHHAAKRDAPSGTAIMIERSLRRAGYRLPVDLSSARAGHVPGTHTLGFDGPAETLSLTHTVRDRATFAHGALSAARWIIGRQGWFTMRDVLGFPPVSPGHHESERPRS
jgi:4-hydroxy-tetrahydrodipicolinate reductase